MEGKLHILLQWEKTNLLLGFNEIEELYCHEFMGWDGLWLLNISHNNISKIADYAFLI